MRMKNFVTLEELEARLSEIPGMPEKIQESTASLHAALFVGEARKEAHLTQAALAKRIGVSQARVSEMEKGEGRFGLSIGVLDQVAKACGGILRLKFEKQQDNCERRALSAGT